MSQRRADIYTNLANLLAAGVPILRALPIAATGLRGPLAAALRKLTDSLSRGAPLAEALAARGRAFPALDRTILESADTSGRLPDAFKQLARWYYLVARMKRTIISGLIYPCLLLFACIAIPPLPRVILGYISFTRYLRDMTLALVFIFGTVALLYLLYVSIPDNSAPRKAIDRLLLRIPILGKTILLLSLSRYCSAFSTLYSSGVPILTAAQKSAETTGNSAVTSMLAPATLAAASGRPMYTGFSHRLPPDFINAWQTGEESGTLSEVADRLAAQITERAEFRALQLATWLPKIIYFLAVAITAYVILQHARALAIR